MPLELADEPCKPIFYRKLEEVPGGMAESVWGYPNTMGNDPPSLDAIANLATAGPPKSLARLFPPTS
jgi:hypothetical protein